MVSMKDCRSSRKSFSKKPTTKKPTMRLLTRFSNSANSVKNAPLTPLPETRRLQELMTCRITLKSSVPTLNPSTKPWLNAGSSKLPSGKTTSRWSSSPDLKLILKGNAYRRKKAPHHWNTSGDGESLSF